jgi:hypothetical protein
MSDQEKKPQEEQQNQQLYTYDEKTIEKHDRDILSSLAWALILIWAGLVFLAANLGWLDQINVQPALPEGLEFVGLSTWSVIFLGAGLIIFIEAVIRTFFPAYHASGGNFFLAAIFLGIGLGGIFGWKLVWPFILIAMGLSALASALISKRK